MRSTSSFMPRRWQLARASRQSSCPRSLSPRASSCRAPSRAAEVAEVENRADAVSYLARNRERLLIAHEGRRVVAAQARGLAEAVQKVADHAAVAEFAVECERLRLELLGLLELSERVVCHAERLQAVGAHAARGLAQLVRQYERAVSQSERGARVAESGACLTL